MNVNGGNFIMKAGNLTANNMAYGLIFNNTSTYTQTGGTYSTNAIIGLANTGGNSTVNIIGGSLTTTNGSVSATELAVRGTTIFNLSGTGTVTTPTLNMSTSQIGSGGATSTFNLDGGTLRSSASSTTYMTGLTNAFVKAGGAVIDTQAFNVTIGQDLLTDVVSTGGGLTKQGPGTLALTGSNTYIGSTTVTAGTLQMGGSLSGAVTVAAAGTLAPGPASAIGCLTLASPLTVAGKLSFRIDRSNSQNADVLTAPSLALAGGVVVNNIGPALQNGDSFKLPDISGSLTQSQVTFSLPTLPSGLRWDDGSLLTTGILKVALDQPVAAAQSVTTPEDTAKPIALAGTDLQGSPLTYTIVTQPAGGTLSGTPPNLTYTPNANFNGADGFTKTPPFPTRGSRAAGTHGDNPSRARRQSCGKSSKRRPKSSLLRLARRQSPMSHGMPLKPSPSSRGKLSFRYLT